MLVYVSQDGVRPAPGKRIDILGTTLSRSTDANGFAVFTVHAGSYVVRAYALGGPGPGFAFVDQSVKVEPAGTTEAKFNDCTMCVSPTR